MYDIIVVGGGLGGASLAKAMAEHGVRVLVVERESQFKDRVRGDGIFQWGVAELKELGLYQLVLDHCAREVPWFDTYLAGERIGHRNLASTTPQETAAVNWIHCEMEEVLLSAAEQAGAEVRRGTSATGLKPGAQPAVCIEYEGRSEELPARLVVCADGRSSLARKWGNFSVHQDSYGMLIAGILCEGMPDVLVDTNNWLMNPASGQYAFFCPQGDGRVRAYVFHPRYRNYRFQGVGDLPRLTEDALEAGTPREWIAQLKPIGPLATFDGADSWVDHPYHNGIALIGDAAAANDPSYGQGQSLTVRDVRVLRDVLLSNNEWDHAGHLFAAEHDHYYAAIHKFERWVYQLFYETGPEADSRRTRALPLLAQEPARMPDAFFSGPEVALDETARRRFFGED
jgi:2-polyprenyl-6-methoxyphenol hydroxylase-like FAD-dependent oxidoreductase